MTAAELTSRLVAIPSENLAPHETRPDARYEADVADFLADYLADKGIQVRRQPVLPGRDNVVATLPGRSDAVLLLDAHMDTVPGDNMDVEPFSGEVRNGRIWGRGASDTKGALAATVHALGRLADDDEGHACTVVFVATVDEEAGFRGMARFAEDFPGADGAIVGEPTSLSIVTATKGAARWNIRTKGVAAHTCHPERGVNAIYKMADVVCAIRSRLLPALAQRHHPLVGPPKLSVSMIAGGRRNNIVPDECTITVDRRIVPGEDPREVFPEVERLLDELRAKDPELVVEMLQPSTVLPGTQASDSDRIVRVARQASLSVLGRDDLTGVAYTTHASVLAQRGIPCVVFGPGSARQAHAAVEYVSVEEV
ncbi:MAG: M20 family metallopeptidase, partial [Armatimonadota bacterium]